MEYYTNVRVVGNQVYLRYIDEDGAPKKKKVNYGPTAFVAASQINNGIEDGKYKTLGGKNLKPIYKKSIKEMRDFYDRYKDLDSFTIYGNENFAFSFVGDTYPEDIEYDIKDIVVANIDIEVASDDGFPYPETAASPVISIAIKFNEDDFYVFGFNEPEGCEIEETLSRQHIKYVSCKDEADLLGSFLACWNQHGPDIVTGWNVSGFDIPYLHNRIVKVLGEKKVSELSPWKFVKTRTFTAAYGKEQMVVDIAGVATLDYLEMYKKFTYANQESYRLDYISHVELGEGKLSYDELGTLHTLYKRDYHKFIEYNVKDVELVSRLDDKMKFIEMAVALAYSAKVNFDDVFSQVKMWDSICYHHLRPKNIVVPPRRSADKDFRYEGAYVKAPQVGAHDWVVSFDLNSLYPHLMMQYNLSPEKLVPIDRVPEDLRGSLSGMDDVSKVIEKTFDTSLLDKYALTAAPNGQFFRTDSQGFLPEILEDLYRKRTESKKKMIEFQKLAEKSSGVEKRRHLNQVAKHNNDQLARKVQLNSAYGALGNKWFRFFDVRIAEAVTKAGQLSIRWIEERMNEYMNDALETEGGDFVIASDTDSIYVRFDEVIQMVYGDEPVTDERVVDFLDKASSERIEPYIDKCYNDLADYMNAFDQKMFMKREAIASRGIWTAKKRYALNVYDNEGVRYAEPKLKIMGMEAVKSSTPEVCREKIKDALKVIMSGTEKDTQKFIDDFKEEFKSLPPEEVAFPRGVNGIRKYAPDGVTYIKHTPIHVKGSIIYNRLIAENGLQNDYERIADGDKIKFLYLKSPNPVKDSVISIVNNLPSEFGLREYIDYDKQFVKAFLDPVEGILKSVGWNSEETSSLERFFV